MRHTAFVVGGWYYNMHGAKCVCVRNLGCSEVTQHNTGKCCQRQFTFIKYLTFNIWSLHVRKPFIVAKFCIHIPHSVTQHPLYGHDPQFKKISSREERIIATNPLCLKTGF